MFPSFDNQAPMVTIEEEEQPEEEEEEAEEPELMENSLPQDKNFLSPMTSFDVPSPPLSP